MTESENQSINGQAMFSMETIPPSLENQNFDQYTFVGIDKANGMELIDFEKTLRTMASYLAAFEQSDLKNENTNRRDILELKYLLAEYVGITDPSTLELKELLDNYISLKKTKEFQENEAPGNPNCIKNAYLEAILQFLNEHGFGINMASELEVQNLIIDMTDQKIYVFDTNKIDDEVASLIESHHYERFPVPSQNLRIQIQHMRESLTLP